MNTTTTTTTTNNNNNKEHHGSNTNSNNTSNKHHIKLHQTTLNQSQFIRTHSRSRTSPRCSPDNGRPRQHLKHRVIRFSRFSDFKDASSNIKQIPGSSRVVLDASKIDKHKHTTVQMWALLLWVKLLTRLWSLTPPGSRSSARSCVMLTLFVLTLLTSQHYSLLLVLTLLSFFVLLIANVGPPGSRSSARSIWYNIVSYTRIL